MSIILNQRISDLRVEVFRLKIFICVSKRKKEKSKIKMTGEFVYQNKT